MKRFLMAAILAPAGSWAATANVAADAYISSANPAQNFGNLPNLNVGGGNSALIGFDLSGLPSGLGASNIQKATLTVFVSKALTAGNLDLLQVTSGWSEPAVTYNGQPTTGAQWGVAAVGQSGAYAMFDITGLVRQWVTGAAPNYGVAIAAEAATVATLDSKEATGTSHAPVVDVTIVSMGPAGPAGAQGPTGPAGAPGAPAVVTLSGVCAALLYPDIPSCQAALSPPYKLVFLTRGQFNGNLGGVAGADQKCQTEATAAGLGGTFKAWISADGASASSRLVHSTVAYRLPDGSRTLVAASFTDLINNGPQNGIGIHADGSSSDAALAWTATLQNGTGTGSNCVNWSSTSSFLFGLVGQTSTVGWTVDGTEPCSSAYPLYCFQQ